MYILGYTDINTCINTHTYVGKLRKKNTIIIDNKGNRLKTTYRQPVSTFSINSSTDQGVSSEKKKGKKYQ